MAIIADFMIRKLLEKNTSGFKPLAFIVSKLQILLISLLLIFILKNFIGNLLSYFFLTLFSAYYLYVLLSEARVEVEDNEFTYYLLFFLMLLLAVLISFILLELGYNMYAFAVPFVLITTVFATSLLFRRNYCFATVAMSDKSSAVVEKDFDLLSLTSAGRYFVENKKCLPKGKKVKVAVKSTIFGRKPYKIIYDK